MSSQQQPTSSTFYRVCCNFWDRVLFQFFRSRFVLFPQPLHDTLLTTDFLGVSVIYRQSPFTPPPFPGLCVVHTLQKGFLLSSVRGRHVWPLRFQPRPPPVFHGFAGVSGRREALPSRRVCLTRRLGQLPFRLLLLDFCCVWVLVTQYILQIIFTGDSGFVASVPQVKGLASSKALPLHTFILNFVLGLFSPIVFYFVFFLLM
jgi:hypothetical protein